MLALLAALSILAAGYHPGAEDDGVYLCGHQARPQPGVVSARLGILHGPIAGDYFRQVGGRLGAATHCRWGWYFLKGLALSRYFSLLWGCRRISQRCLLETYAQWASVSLVAVLLTLPVAGSALYLVDQNLHPRALATAAILAAIIATIDRKILVGGRSSIGGWLDSSHHGQLRNFVLCVSGLATTRTDFAGLRAHALGMDF